MTAHGSMYERVMGESFGCLADSVQQFHRLVGKHELAGMVQVDTPKSILAILLARLLGTPLSANQGPIKFKLDARPSEETWTRHFPSNVMISHLQLRNGQLVEKLGAAQLTFALLENSGRLNMQLRRLQFFGIPCPKWLMPIVVAEETGIDGRLYFHVRAEVIFVGVVASYQGYLSLSSGASP